MLRRPCRNLVDGKGVSLVCTSEMPHFCSVIASDVFIEEKAMVVRVTAGIKRFSWLYEASFN